MLHSIGTGSIATVEVKEDISNVKVRWQGLTFKCLNERLKNQSVSFWDTINKLPLNTFSAAEKLLKLIQKTKDLLLSRLNFTFLRLLTVSKTRIVDLISVKLYNILGVPLSISYSTGEQRKSTKRKLLHELEVTGYSVEAVGFHHDSATILDFVAIIQSTIQKKVGTCGQPLDNLKSSVSSAFQKGNIIVLAPDRFDVKQSMKSAERSRHQ